MAELNKNIIDYISQLSRIHCTGEEKEALLIDLEKILDYVEQLQEIETEHVAPCHHVLEESGDRMREDEVGEVLSREDFLQNAPSQIGGMIRVPPVMKGK